MIGLFLVYGLFAQEPHILASARKEQLSVGTLYLPSKMRLETPLPLVIFFHGAGAPEIAAQENRTAVLSVYFATNSDPYVAAFSRPMAFANLIREAEARTNFKFGPFILGCFSAGCGAVRSVLRDDLIYEKTRAVFAMDGIYAEYVGKSNIAGYHMDVWLRLTKDSIVGRKQFLVTHTDVECDNYACAKQTGEWLLDQIGLKRNPAKRGVRLTPATEAQAGGFLLLGFPGIESSHHLDQLSLVSECLRLLTSRR